LTNRLINHLQTFNNFFKTSFDYLPTYVRTFEDIFNDFVILSDSRESKKKNYFGNELDPNKI
jgi:hypothetical protein